MYKEVNINSLGSFESKIVHSIYEDYLLVYNQFKDNLRVRSMMLDVDGENQTIEITIYVNNECDISLDLNVQTEFKIVVNKIYELEGSFDEYSQSQTIGNRKLVPINKIVRAYNGVSFYGKTLSEDYYKEYEVEIGDSFDNSLLDELDSIFSTSDNWY